MANLGMLLAVLLTALRYHAGRDRHYRPSGTGRHHAGRHRIARFDAASRLDVRWVNALADMADRRRALEAWA